MTLTAARADKLTDYFVEDVERAKELFGLPLSEAIVRINADGNYFTESELIECVEYISNSFKDNDCEIGENDMSQVNGGEAVCRRHNNIARVF